MRIWIRVAIVLVLMAGAAVAAAYYLNRDRLARQWAAHGVASAATFDQARARLAAIETAGDRDARIRELTACWGRGDQQFDLYLAWYAGHPASSEFLRETFSLEFAWREELLPRWAHYWSWRAVREPDAEIAQIVDYMDLLVESPTPRPITWREVLDLQAVFALSGNSRLALRLTPDNWAGRYRQWRESRPQPLEHVVRPEQPLPDWQGPVPDRRRLAHQ